MGAHPPGQDGVGPEPDEEPSELPPLSGPVPEVPLPDGELYPGKPVGGVEAP